MKRKNMDLTTGSIPKKLLIFALPIIFSAILQDFYNIADKIVVGQFAENGGLALAAVGAVTPAVAILVDLFTGLSMGVNVICANLRGAKKYDDLDSAMHTALLLAFFCGLGTMCFGMIMAQPMIRFIKTPDTISRDALTYMCIYFSGIPVSLLYNSGAGILLSNGDTRRPMMILTVSGLVNVALNMLLVIGCGLGVAGVAIGTVASQLVSAVWVCCILFDPNGEYKMSIHRLRMNRTDAGAFLKIAVPAAINNTVFDFSNFFMQAAVNTLGDAVIAGCTAASSIGNLSYKVPAGFYSTCVSFSGQNYGAKQFKRIDKTLLWSIGMSMVGVVMCASVLTLFPERMLSIFNSDPAVIQGGIPKLLILSWGYLAYCCQGCISGTLHGLKRNTATTVINMIFVVGTRLPWALILFPMFPTSGFLFMCYPISWLLCSIAQGIFFLRVRKKLWLPEKEVAA